MKLGATGRQAHRQHPLGPCRLAAVVRARAAHRQSHPLPCHLVSETLGADLQAIRVDVRQQQEEAVAGERRHRHVEPQSLVCVLVPPGGRSPYGHHLFRNHTFRPNLSSPPHHDRCAASPRSRSANSAVPRVPEAVARNGCAVSERLRGLRMRAPVRASTGLALRLVLA